MTPRIIDLLSNYQANALRRFIRVEREGSPTYHFDVGALAGNAYVEFDIARFFPAAKKYEPLDTCFVINNDTVDIQLNFNGGTNQPYIIPAGVIRRITREEVAAIWQVRVTNLNATTAVTVDLIDLELSRSPADADSVARDMI